MLKKLILILVLLMSLIGCSQKPVKEEIKNNDLVEIFQTSYSKVEIRILEADLKQFQLKKIESNENRVIFANVEDIKDFVPSADKPLLTVAVEVVDMGGTPYKGSEEYVINLDKKDVRVVLDHFSNMTTVVSYYPFSETQDLMVSIVGSYVEPEELKTLMQHLVEQIKIIK